MSFDIPSSPDDTNSFTNIIPMENIQLIDETEDSFCKDVQKILNEALDKKLKKEELMLLFGNILSIMQKQVELNINEYRSSDFTPIDNNQFYQAQLPFINNMYSYTNPYINPVNFQQNFAYQPLMYPNYFGNNFYLQQQQQPIINQQYIFNPGQIRPSKKEVQKSKSIKKVKTEKKSSKRKSKSSNSETVNTFNNSLIEKQKSFIKDLLKNNPKLKVLKKLLKLFQYIEKFNPSTTDNYLSISTKEDDNELSLEKGFQHLEQIQFSPNLTRLFESKNQLKSENFLSQLSKFKHVLIEIQYPSPAFDTIYQQILDLKRKDSNLIRIGIFISGIKETDVKFRKNEEIYSVRFDEGVKVIKGGTCMHNSINDGGSFRGCSSLHQVILSNSVKIIGENSFKECSSLRSISIPSSVVKISCGAFVSCKSLEKITFATPSSLKSIDLAAFSLCSGLKEIKIPPTVETIEKWAFNGCSSLKEFTIPNSVTSVEREVFKGCSSLTQITVPKRISTNNFGLNSNVRVNKV